MVAMGPRLTWKLFYISIVFVYSSEYILLERPRCHTATTMARLQEDIRTSFRTFMRNIRPVARHAVLGAIEDGIAVRVVGIFRPRPVRLVAPIPAFIA